MISKDREYRQLTIERRDPADGAYAYKVRGYASTFEPYVLWVDDEGNEYREQIDPHAFDEADLSDVIFLYNHEGMVYARNRNGSLNITTDSHGLRVEADLSKTSKGRELFEAIDSGLIDQMSFAFRVQSDEYDRATRTRTIHRIQKVYDVSAVSIPANPGTDITTVSARDYFNGVIEMEQAERLEELRRLELARAKYDFMEVKSDEH